jgi:hypothetical protein
MFSERGREYNLPWLKEAIARDDVFKVATAPKFGEGSPLFSLDGRRLSGFGREYLELRRNGYRYDANTGELVRAATDN